MGFSGTRIFSPSYFSLCSGACLLNDRLTIAASFFLCWCYSEEFATRSDASTAFEEFLNASKGQLTASEIAKIRDRVGVVGMAGT